MSDFFRELVSGRKRGLLAGSLRGLLRCVEFPYTWVVGSRNRAFDQGTREIRRLEVPVVSIGNLSLGGTGKTPMVAYIANFLKNQGYSPGILSRGYGAEKSAPNDEAMELSWRLPDVPHEQDRDRFTAGKRLLSSGKNVNIAILDDGFQHRKLFRNYDIVLIDAKEPFGFSHVFPRGTLREPLESLARADAVILSKANLISEEERKRIRETASKYAPNSIWAEAAHVPSKIVRCDSDDPSRFDAEEIGDLSGTRALAVCGIGNPNSFTEGTLKSLGIEVLESLAFPDHRRFSATDIELVEKTVKRRAPEAVFCTMKDIVKLHRPEFSGVPLKAIGIDIGFLEGEHELTDSIIERIRNHPF